MAAPTGSGTESEIAELLSDMEIRRNCVVPEQRADIVVLSKPKRTAAIIPVAVPSDRNKDTEREKIAKYRELY